METYVAQRRSKEIRTLVTRFKLSTWLFWPSWG